MAKAEELIAKISVAEGAELARLEKRLEQLPKWARGGYGPILANPAKTEAEGIPAAIRDFASAWRKFADKEAAPELERRGISVYRPQRNEAGAILRDADGQIMFERVPFNSKTTVKDYVPRETNVALLDKWLANKETARQVVKKVMDLNPNVFESEAAASRYLREQMRIDSMGLGGSNFFGRIIKLPEKFYLSPTESINRYIARYSRTIAENEALGLRGLNYKVEASSLMEFLGKPGRIGELLAGIEREGGTSLRSYAEEAIKATLGVSRDPRGLSRFVAPFQDVVYMVGLTRSFIKQPGIVANLVKYVGFRDMVGGFGEAIRLAFDRGGRAAAHEFAQDAGVIFQDIYRELLLMSYPSRNLATRAILGSVAYTDQRGRVLSSIVVRRYAERTAKDMAAATPGSRAAQNAEMALRELRVNPAEVMARAKAGEALLAKDDYFNAISSLVTRTNLEAGWRFTPPAMINSPLGRFGLTLMRFDFAQGAFWRSMFRDPKKLLKVIAAAGVIGEIPGDVMALTDARTPFSRRSVLKGVDINQLTPGSLLARFFVDNVSQAVGFGLATSLMAGMLEEAGAKPPLSVGHQLRPIPVDFAVRLMKQGLSILGDLRNVTEPPRLGQVTPGIAQRVGRLGFEFGPIPGLGRHTFAKAVFPLPEDIEHIAPETPGVSVMPNIGDLVESLRLKGD